MFLLHHSWCTREHAVRLMMDYKKLGQHRTIPALRLKHRSDGCGTASALPKCSIMSGCGTRIVLRFAVSATGGAHLCSIQYYLRFWPSICRTSLAVSALRIMRYCPNSNLVMGINSAPARCLVLYFKAKYPAQPHKIALSTNKQFFLKNSAI